MTTETNQALQHGMQVERRVPGSSCPMIYRITAGPFERSGHAHYVIETEFAGTSISSDVDAERVAELFRELRPSTAEPLTADEVRQIVDRVGWEGLRRDHPRAWHAIAEQRRKDQRLMAEVLDRA